MRSPVAVACVGFVAACSPPPLPGASYEPPSNKEAMDAFRFALASDSHAVGETVREFKESDVTAFGYQSGVANNNRRIENEHGIRMVAALQRFKTVDCAWQPFSEKGLPAVSRQRIVDPAPRAAYFCTFEAHYQINPPHGKPVSTNSDGYFMKDETGFVFAGKYDDPYR